MPQKTQKIYKAACYALSGLFFTTHFKKADLCFWRSFEQAMIPALLVFLTHFNRKETFCMKRRKLRATACSRAGGKAACTGIFLAKAGMLPSERCYASWHHLTGLSIPSGAFLRRGCMERGSPRAFSAREGHPFLRAASPAEKSRFLSPAAGTFCKSVTMVISEHGDRA